MTERAREEIGVNLAVSLHAVTKEVRDEIVPINKKYGIEELLAACAAYPGANNARRITFEYVMLKGKNDSDDDARELVRLIRKYRLPAKVNLIPFNPWPGAAYECSDDDRIARFSDIIFKAGISAPVRTPRGRDIMAACGQHKSAAEKISRAEPERRAAEKEAAWKLGGVAGGNGKGLRMSAIPLGSPPRCRGRGGTGRTILRMDGGRGGKEGVREGRSGGARVC